ncbi:hypothetical protein CAI21_19905 [Alkalilimnicola ehrlichii]|uniref:Uncharacterized protein n=1 Tax=Alkalilimnicola ehrlichii TaxID=351052 RepID=A0A3E0WJQ8_9GAMM|nr:lipopolysaccharide biosynthesis protein [Alkalilimnicola ehrlichii]RFA25161.1 hypothetical protein CAI21_19905 [Alkalilimnicola ehrlichii]RFA32115.1 hypothetical protein CAL65_20485 [Alkalilimnicola ehrlichii]
MDFATVKRAVITGFAWQGATKVVVQTASWASTIFVARLIAPSDYGVMAAAAMFTQLLVLVTELGMAQGLIQAKETTRRQEDGVFYLSLLLGVLTYGGLYLVTPFVAAFFDMPILNQILPVLGVVVILGSLKTVPLAIVMRKMNFRYRSLVEMGQSLVMTVTVIVLAVQGFGVWSLVWGPIAANLFVALAYLPLLKRIPLPTMFSSAVVRIVSFGVKVTATNVLYFSWTRSDVTIIGRFLGERALGFYSMAFQFALLPLDKVGSIFNQVLFPALSRLQDNLAESRQLFLSLHRALLIISYPLIFGLIAIADDFIELLLTEVWLPIVPYLQVLCLVSAVRISGMLMPPVLYARGQPGLMVRYSVLCASVLPLTFFIGAQYGLPGVVLGWLLVYPFLYLVLARFGLRALGLRWRELLQSAAPAVTATLAMFLGVVLFRTYFAESLPLFTRVFAAIGVGGALYLGVLAVLFRTQLAELKQRVLMLRGGNASL